MTDSRQAHGPEGIVAERTGGDPARLRERMREIIRAEVGKLNPTEDARHPLELIVESSVRCTDVHGMPRITVVDQKGQPRMVERNGQSVEYTLHDLLDEIRLSHPVLFRSGEQPIEVRTPPPAAPPERQERPERDWLAVGSGSPAEAAEGQDRWFGNALFHLRRGRMRLHGWSRKKVDEWTGPGSADRDIGGPVPAGGASATLGRMRSLFDGARERGSSRPPGLALGALALAALLGVGVYAVTGRDDATSPPAVRLEEPAATGAVSSQQAAAVEAPAPSSSRVLQGVPDVIDTATLSLEGEVVRLFGVEWAPGGGKPEDLTRYLQGREVICDPASANDTYRCKVGGQDLSRVVLFNGGGKPTAEASADLKAAADKAREAKLGVWSP